MRPHCLSAAAAVLALQWPLPLLSQSPAFAIDRLDPGTVRVAWPATFADWRLERAPGLDDPAAWSLVDEPTLPAGALLQADVPISSERERDR